MLLFTQGLLPDRGNGASPNQQHNQAEEEQAARQVNKHQPAGQRDDRELFAAAKAGNAAKVRQLLVASRANLEFRDAHGYTALSWAAINGHKDIALLLLEKGAKVDNRDNIGATPLYLAASNGHVALVRTLIQNGAAINSKDNEGRAPTWTAAFEGHTELVEFLLEIGATVDATNVNGSTPLHVAAQEGHLDVVKLLVVKGGADISKKQKHGETALDVARRNKRDALVQYLTSARRQIL